MKIVLINMPFIFENKLAITYSQSLGILYIASFLEKHGYTVNIIDALHEGYENIIEYEDYYKVGLNNECITKRIEKDVDVIGLSIPFSHFAKLAHNLIDDIKKSFPNVPLVIGGVYPSTQPELAIKSKADFLVMGEGEEPMLNILNNLQKKTTNLYDSIITTEADLINAKSHYTKDISILPMPARHLIPFNDYTKSSQRSTKDLITASITTSRGCPYDCGFCSIHKVFGYKWRPFTAEYVLNEINYLIDTYNINNIEIEDDNFTNDPIRAEKILKGIIEINNTKKKITWQAQNGLRIDTIDEKLVKLFKLSKGRKLNLAIEHGNKEVLELINKKLDLNKVIEVAKLYSKYQIEAYVFIIFGYPGETKKRFKDALKFYKKIRNIAPHLIFCLFIVQPYPNTKLFYECVKNKYLPADLFNDINNFKRFSPDNEVWIETEDFNKKEVLRRRKILRKELQLPMKNNNNFYLILKVIPSFFYRNIFNLLQKLLSVIKP